MFVLSVKSTAMPFLCSTASFSETESGLPRVAASWLPIVGGAGAQSSALPKAHLAGEEAENQGRQAGT